MENTNSSQDAALNKARATVQDARAFTAQHAGDESFLVGVLTERLTRAFDRESELERKIARLERELASK